jgi:cytoskeletal protein CcmA (bactofilin family)
MLRERGSEKASVAAVAASDRSSVPVVIAVVLTVLALALSSAVPAGAAIMPLPTAGDRPIGSPLSRVVSMAAAGAAGDAVAEAVGRAASHGAGKLQFLQEDEYLLPYGETEVKDLYLFAQSLSIDGTLDGDLICWVQTASITGTVTEDVNLFAQMVTIDGVVEDDVRLFAQNLYINGTVKGEALILAANVFVGKGAVIEGDALVACGTCSMDGTIAGDARLVGGTVSMNGTIDGNAEIMTDGGITLGNEASIGGDLHYTSPVEIEFQRGIVTGTISFDKSEKEEASADLDFKVPSFLGVLFKLLQFVGALIVGAILVAFTKNHARKTAETIRTRSMQSLGIGFVAFILAPIVALIALILIVTAPLSWILTLGFLIGIYIAKFYVAIWLGDLILRRSNRPDTSPMLSMILGLAILYLITAIPIVGTLAMFFIIFFGLGALLQRRGSRLERAFQSENPEPSDGLPRSFPAAPAPPAPPAAGVGE